MRRSASLFGLLGLVFLVFGFLGLALIPEPLSDARVLVNLIAGAGLLLAYFAFGFEDFRSLLGQRSTRYGAGAAVYSLLFLALVLGANYLSYRHHHRWDVTEAGIYTLAPQSAKLVQSLSQDLAMTAFVEGGQDPQLDTLLESYKYAAPSRVSYRLVDPDQEPGLVEQMKVTALRSLHLQYANESFVVTNPTEETITNGIIRISGGRKKTVYFVEGHGEADLANAEDPNGFSEAKLALEQENYDVKTLLLPAAQEIPADATAVVVGGPERPLADREVEVLDAYLARGGHLFVMVGPRERQEKLQAMLQRWGVKLGDDIVIDREVRLFEGPRLGVVPLTKTYGTHPITENFRDFTMFPQTRSVEPAAEGRKGLSATALVKTSASSWAETSVEDVFTKNVAAVDDGDRRGPVSVAVAVAAKLEDIGVTPPAGADGKTPDEARLVVIGSPLFAGNQQIAQMRLNGDLFLNAVGWLVGQDELVSIRSRSVRASRAELTPREQGQLFYLSVLLVPQLMIATGIAVWWRRKSR
jgi:ABC-type uncharacterized transport system involved in gliding motility auxiliary subunit